MKVAPSILAADFTILAEEITRTEQAGADLLHLDVMDGIFVPNITFGPVIVEAVNRVAKLPLDAHLMIVEPEKYIERFMESGADWISFHAEATKNIVECIKLIRSGSCKVGLAISPPTPWQGIIEFISEIDFILIMTVNPGFYGQDFIAEVVPKIKEVREHIVKEKLPCLIEVDGGINAQNARIVCDAGVDVAVAGAAVYKTSDYKTAIKEIRCLKD